MQVSRQKEADVLGLCSQNNNFWFIWLLTAKVGHRQMSIKLPL